MSFVSTPQIFLYVESVGMNWNDWPKQLEDKNHFLFANPSCTTSFAITDTGVVTLRRDILIVVHPFITHCFCCGQDCTQACSQARLRWMLPLVVLAWETSQKITLFHPGWHQRKREDQTKFLVIRNWKSIWDAIRYTPGVSPSCLGGRTGRDKQDACVCKGQTKSDQRRKVLMESLSTPPSRAGRDASSGKKPWLWMPLFSLLQMGANSSRTTPLKCILKNGDKFDPQNLKKTHLIFFCNTE